MPKKVKVPRWALKEAWRVLSDEACRLYEDAAFEADPEMRAQYKRTADDMTDAAIAIGKRLWRGQKAS